MCGFVGFTEQIGNRDLSVEIALRMLDALSLRGPDGCRAGCWDGATLGHCRLAFVDPGNGHQPFESASGRWVLAFNGEIYNHPELRAELRAAGARLRTRSDTEVLVELWEREGEAVLRRVRGMYAFALYDRAERRLVLARDLFGKKPLVWFRTANGVVFASETTALLRHPACPREVDPRALAAYLVLNAVSAPCSLLAGVTRLPAGTLREFGPAGERETRFWEPRFARERSAAPAAELEQELEMRLEAAVRRRLRSTSVLVGALLSGGLDSSCIAALAQRQSATPLRTFSAGFESAAFDETPHALAVSRHLGTEHHVVRLGSRELADLVAAEYPRLDEPLADPSLLPMLAVCRLARTHVRAVLSGDGADELLMGYRVFQAERVMGWIERALPRAARRRLAVLTEWLPVRHGNLGPAAVARLLARSQGEPPEHRFYQSTAAFQLGEMAALLRPDAWSAVRGIDPYMELDRALARQPALPRLERLQLGIVWHFLRDVVLPKVDRASMLYSLEIRSPFLDGDLAEFAFSLPLKAKMRGFDGKYLLKRVARRHLPPEIVARTKQGFRAPVGRLLCDDLRPLLLDTLSPSHLARHGLLKPAAVERLLREHLRGTVDHARRLWGLLCFQLWYDAHLASRVGGETRVRAGAA